MNEWMDGWMCRTTTCRAHIAHTNDKYLVDPSLLSQVFIPSVPVAAYAPTHHVDILCALGPMPSAAEWEAKGLDKYGLIAVNASGEAAQVRTVVCMPCVCRE